MSHLNLTSQSFEFSINQIEKNFENEKGILFKSLVYIAIFTTVLLFSFLKPMNIYKRFITWFFDLTITIKGEAWKIYHILLLIVGFLTVFFICKIFYFYFLVLKMQSDNFSIYQIGDETHYRKIWRLKYKWLIESEMWLTSLIIIELV